jgi:ribose transport system substrate-binding protein
VSLKRLVTVIAVVALSGLVFAACGSSGDDNNKPSGNTATPAGASAEESTAAVSSGKKTIGIVSFIEADEATRRTSSAVKKAAETKGWSVKLIDTNLDATKQIAAFDTFVNDKVDGIITIYTDNVQNKAAIAKAKQAGIPVMSIGGGQWVDGLTLDVGIPDMAAGGQAAQYFFDTIKKKYGDKKQVNVIQFTLPEGNPCRAREKAFDGMAQLYPNVKVSKYHINGTNPVAAANDYMATKLNDQGKDLVGVLSCWGLPAQGAATAAKAKGRDDFLVVGINGDTAEIDLVRQGDKNFQATVALGLAEAGNKVIQELDKVFADKADLPASGRTYMPIQLVTPESLPSASKYDITLPKGWDADYWRKSA